MELSFDSSAFDALSKILVTEINSMEKIDGAHTRVGYTTDSGAIEFKTGKGLRSSKINRQLTKVALAVIHEYGAGHIPSRPFMRQAFQNNLEQIEKVSTSLHKQYLDGKITKQQALSRLGEWYGGVIKKEIRNGNFTPLSPITIKMKGSDKPLIDTGLNLLGGVDHKEVL